MATAVVTPHLSIARRARTDGIGSRATGLAPTVRVGAPTVCKGYPTLLSYRVKRFTNSMVRATCTCTCIYYRSSYTQR